MGNGQCLGGLYQPRYGSSGTWIWSYVPDDGPSGSQVVVITAKDQPYGASSQTIFDLVVNNVAPQGVLTNSGPIEAGGAASVFFAAPSDPSLADIAAGLRSAYDFDNGAIFEIGDGTYAGFAASVYSTVLVPPGHLLGGVRTVRGSILDKDSGHTDLTTDIEVLSYQVTLMAAGGLQVEVSGLGTFVHNDTFEVRLGRQYGVRGLSANGSVRTPWQPVKFAAGGSHRRLRGAETYTP